MPRNGLVAVLAATAFGVFANAGRCRPITKVSTSLGYSLEPTSTVSETLSLSVGELSTTTDTEEPEATDTFIITGTTTDMTTDTTTVEVSESTTTAEATATMPEQPPCSQTQIIVNPSFNDNTDGSPWVLDPDARVSNQNPRTDPFLCTSLSFPRVLSSVNCLRISYIVSQLSTVEVAL